MVAWSHPFSCQLPLRKTPEAYSLASTKPAQGRIVCFSGTTSRDYALIISRHIGEMTKTLDGLDMNCRICGRTSAPGAKLCPDCRAARKRAFDATVTQPLLAGAGGRSRGASRLLKPSKSLSDASRRAARQAQAAKQAQTAKQAEVASAPLPGRTASQSKWPLAVAAVAIVLIAGAYVTQRFGAATKTAASTQPTTEQSVGDAPVATQVKSSESASAAARSAATPSPAGPISMEAPVFQPAPSTPAGTEAGKRPNTRARPAPPTAVATVPEPPPVVEPVAPPPPPPVVREAPRPDPWQQMNDALARCPRDDMSGRLMCEQRVRSQHCDGHWGQVPQCASVPYIDHGG